MALLPTGQRTGVADLLFAVTTLKPLVNMERKDLFIAKCIKLSVPDIFVCQRVKKEFGGHLLRKVIVNCSAKCGF
ncbi:hypothetical protein CKF94_17525 [Vibrio coralliilyticus]|uniref:hypothetical protein n=1 Tax=Vibrio coralliilyticus TaxID=190893 RepID=UPI000BAABF9E|nr:hypothetical protein [Vibrio coralliilyticus]MCC2522156.1 hypothetical protein [Vibrio coralliilyticus]PAU36780.1 hypothetical protein CKF94_17525 [Vibrio coralliilyticus]